MAFRFPLLAACAAPNRVVAGSASSPAHPRLLVTEAEWASLPARQRRDPDVARLTAAILARARSDLAKPPVEHRLQGRRLLGVSREFLRRSLFWKILLAFWLTLLLAGVGAGLVVWAVRHCLRAEHPALDLSLLREVLSKRSERSLDEMFMAEAMTATTTTVAAKKMASTEPTARATRVAIESPLSPLHATIQGLLSGLNLFQEFRFRL